MKIRADTVEQYLAALSPDRREALSALRKAVLANLDRKGFEEGMQYGMIGYYVPHRVHPAGYHCDPKQPVPFLSLGAQKNHLALYMFSLYAMPGELAWFLEEWKKTGKKLDMGKSCVRFKRLEDVPVELIGRAVKRVSARDFLEVYQSVVARPGRSRAGARQPASPGKPAAGKAAKKVARKSATKAGSAPRKRAARHA